MHNHVVRLFYCQMNSSKWQQLNEKSFQNGCRFFFLLAYFPSVCFVLFFCGFIMYLSMQIPTVCAYTLSVNKWVTLLIRNVYNSFFLLLSFFLTFIRSLFFSLAIHNPNCTPNLLGYIYYEYARDEHIIGKCMLKNCRVNENRTTATDTHTNAHIHGHETGKFAANDD